MSDDPAPEPASSPGDSVGTRWLDPVEQRLWRGFLEVSGRVVQSLDAGLKRDSGMTLDDYEVLVHLSEADGGRLRMTDLSARLLYSQSRITQRVDRLAGRGWVAREKSAHDRRVTYAMITDEGLRVLRAAVPGHVADVRRYLIDLIDPADLERFGEVFDHLARTLRARSSEPTGDAVADPDGDGDGAAP